MELETPCLPKPRILCSEDDPDSREMMRLILGEEGFEVVFPEESHDVLTMAKQVEVDAYVLDSWTEGISDVELCKAIRQFDPHTPIVFYSGATSDEDQDAARAAGAQAYITKPSSCDDLIDAIFSAISTYRRNPF